MDDTQDTLVDVNSPQVPAGIRARVLAMMQPGDELLPYTEVPDA